MWRSTACFELEEHEAALAAFTAGLKLDPNNATLKKWARKAEAELQDGETLYHTTVRPRMHLQEHVSAGDYSQSHAPAGEKSQ